MQKLILWIIVGFSGQAIGKKLPDYVRVCKATDPDLSKCWKESFEAIIPYLTQDRPELNLLSIDPFYIPEFRLNHAPDSNFYLNIVVEDAELIGLSGVQVLDVTAELKDYSLALTLLVPHSSATGNYKSMGKILGIEFAGDGTLSAEFANVTLNATWSGKTYIKKGKAHLRVEAKHIDLTVDKSHVHLGNLFRGNPELNENMNRVFNENSESLFSEFKPILKSALREMIMQYANRFYGEFPLDVLHPKN